MVAAVVVTASAIVTVTVVVNVIGSVAQIEVETVIFPTLHSPPSADMTNTQGRIEIKRD